MLRGECQLDDAVFVTELPGLHLLLPCREGEKSDPALLHDSTMLQAMFEQLRDRYDLVLIDSPALIPVADATALIPLSDGVVLASMAGLTTKHHLARARDLVLGMGGRILGLVVGNVQEAAPEYLDAGYYHGYARPDGKRHFGS
jgi:Mrp family chromosome partitioning ATPase